MNIVLSGFSGSIGKTIFNSFVSTEYNFIPYNMRNDRLEFEHDLENFDVFIHLASLNANLQNQSHLQEELNLSKKALSFCIKRKIKHIIFFSTSQIYSEKNSINGSIDESANIQPENIYASAKLECEEFLLETCKQYDIGLTILRLAPFVDLKSSTKVSKLIKFSSRLRFFPIFEGANKNRKSFLTKKNLISVVDKVLSREQDNSDNLLVFNVADKRPISTNDLVKTFHQKMESHVLYVRMPKFIEIFVSKIPIIKKIYFNLTNNFLLNVSRFEKRYNCPLLETKNSIEL
tara:strand:+ start:1670 stop:2539 length:870 start_codon:yes stop_codon:yes gene_type:complete